MKPLRLVSTPTRNRRLNEIIGLVVLACAVLLFLALATYTPTDPSANTVGGFASGTRSGLAARLGAHNWTGLIGAWFADIILQTIGIAAFFLPIVLGRLGFCWLRQRAAGSAIRPVPGTGPLDRLRARRDRPAPPHALLASCASHRRRHRTPARRLMVHYLNLPGATIVLTLMVAMSLYLATTFTFHTAQRVDRSPLLHRS